MASRLNIGLFVDSLNNPFVTQACIGAELAAKVLDANLVIFPGHYIGTPDSREGNLEYEYQCNTVFNLVTDNNIDVLYVLLGSIGSRASFDVQKAFLDSLPRIPIVTLFTKAEGYASITFNNKSGFSSLIEHIIVEHGAKNIGYVSGPKTNGDAIERLQIFKECLKEHGMTIPRDHIVYGDFTDKSEDVVTSLLDTDPTIDALVCANDRMAIGAYEVLKSRGLMPGKDIIVTGFDDDKCAVGLEPPLTTVEASSADLIYQAVLRANEFVTTGILEGFAVDTYFCPRESCGCGGIDLEIMSKRLGLERITEGTNEFLETTIKYLFGVHSDSVSIENIKSIIYRFDAAFVEALLSDMDAEKTAKVVNIFNDLTKEPILDYTNTERIHNWIQTVQYTANLNLKSERAKLELAMLFSSFYRKLSYMNSIVSENNAEKMYGISQIGNTQLGNIYLVNYDKIQYELLIKDLKSAGIRRAYMYGVQGETKHERGEVWSCPRTMLLKGITDEDGTRALPEEQELIRTENIFDNEFMKRDRRQTFVVTPLFVAQDLYGFLLCELSTKDLGSVTPVSYQTSVSLKTFKMIDEQLSIKRGLEASLEQFRRDNKTLSVISKSDELTGLYNRRGFLEFAQNELKRAENQGKEAIICYCDMDNLKTVNDVYGHDEGDFALKEIASILNDAFRHTDIIGRFGGDEFVVFAIVAKENYEETIKNRIEEITKRHNNNFDKPYYVGMSSGVCEFKCDASLDIYNLLELADEKLYIEKKAKKKGR